MDDVVLTEAGYNGLETELAHLTEVRRAQVAERLQQALELAGDLGDNPEYLDAVRERELVEQRIAVLESRLAAARVLDPEAAPPARVTIGSWVDLEDLDTGDHSRYMIVSSIEADPAHGRLSIESPVGSTVAGHVAGETVDVATPRGTRHLRIAGAGAR